VGNGCASGLVTAAWPTRIVAAPPPSAAATAASSISSPESVGREKAELGLQASNGGGFGLGEMAQGSGTRSPAGRTARWPARWSGSLAGGSAVTGSASVQLFDGNR
jgi:hypothetical protein